MKILVLFGLFLFATSFVNAQKVKIKDDIAYVDNDVYLTWKKQNMGNEVSVYLPNSEEEVLFIRYLDYTDPSRVSKSNPEGKVRWVEFNFLTLELKCEVDTRGNKGLVKLIYENNLITDGALNEENIQKFVSKYGTNYTDNRPNSTIIITR